MIGVVARAEDHHSVREFFELFKTPWEFCREHGDYDVLIRADAAPTHHRAKVVIAYHDSPSIPGPRQHSTMLSWNGQRIPVYGRCVALPPDGTTPRLVREDTREPVASVTRVHGTTLVRVGYDLFEEARFLLTTGQPPANADLPTLERHIGFLRDSIVGSGVPLVEIPPVPSGYRFIVCLTHDIDHPSIRLHRFDHTMFGFLYRAVVRSLVEVCRRRARPTTLLRNWAAAVTLPLVHLGLVKDFWSQFDRYLTIEQGLGSTFFVIPVKNDPGQTVSGQAPRRRASPYGAPDIAEQLRALHAGGCEVALHGLDAWMDASSAVKERACISLVTRASTMGVRMHWLFFDEQAPGRLEEAGFAYDSTFGYNNTVGFRAGTLQAFRPMTAERLLELPLTIMDTALFYPAYRNLTLKAAKQVVWRLLDEAERHGGAVTINWHDRSLAPERLWGDFYVELLDELKRRAAWFPTASQAAAWFRHRRSAVFDSVRWDGDSVRVKLSVGPLHDLPGLTLRVHRPSSAAADQPLQMQRPRRFSDMTFTDALDTLLTPSAS